ncbi:hypothetical protein GCM10023144_30150 [Pigmentiphaga soli]|uniref:DNA ligase D 3'-phosphoesterase domain-containing protein n=1 Tax=Pigmentiphaga soli TaxID=1007095 RepID=A0ABP8H9T0_9BURK
MARTSLQRYEQKRNFDVTPEPRGGEEPAAQGLRFVVQKHWASRLHYDFRLELRGAMKSWAVPKGPSYDPADKRMAVHVEDHPISYNSFEGTIPPKQYGAGRVIIWDKGIWEPEGDPAKGYRAGRLKFRLHGYKLHGRWTLVRMHGREEKQDTWLLMKEKDELARPSVEFSVVDQFPDSVAALPMPPRTEEMEQAAAGAAPRARKAAQGRPQASTMRVTHAERVVDPASGVRKIELIRFYGLMAPLMMPHLKGRPVSIVRAPQGVRGQHFFQKHMEADHIDGLRELDAALWPGHESLLEVVGPPGLLACAQLNVIEFHTWNAVKTTIDKPDRMTFDLDPGEGVQWPMMLQAVELVRVLLGELGLAPFCKTSGGKGLHVVVPLRKGYGWDDVKGFSQAIVRHLAATLPQLFVAKSGPSNRVGRIFIDYLRNGFGATTVSAWSARARPGLGVSVPVAWDEVPHLSGGAHWHLGNIHERLDRGNEPWNGYDRAAKGLAPAMKALGFKPGA